MLVACTMDNGLGSFFSGWGRDDEPVIEVTPDHLSFGALGHGLMKTLDFRITNVGSENSMLIVDRLTIDTPDGFQFTADLGEIDLPQGKSETVSIVFSPSDPVFYEGLVTVESNDESNAAVPVVLDGSGLMPRLEITPDPYDFGAHMIGCTRDGTVTLTNVGNDELVIDDIREVATAFSVTEPLTLPLHLMPGEYGELSLRFAPMAEMAYQGELEVASNDPEGVRQASQMGDGRNPGHYLDTFELPLDPPVDISFFIDRSRSTSDDQEALAENVESFIGRLSEETPDWQIMVVTEDDGCNSSGVLTPSTPDYISRFADATPGGEGGGSFTEAGLIVTTRAMEQTGTGECNQGFHRPGAYFHAIMVSDEPEQSPEPWYSYVEELTRLVGDAGKLRISAIAGDIPTGCRSAGNSAEPGEGYYESSLASGGVFLSLCENWSTHIDALVSATVSRGTFELSRTPVPSSVRVWVNRSERFDDWQYDGSQNAVIFSSAAEPGEGDLVQIEYDEPSVCD